MSITRTYRNDNEKSFYNLFNSCVAKVRFGSVAIAKPEYWFSNTILGFENRKPSTNFSINEFNINHELES